MKSYTFSENVFNGSINNFALKDAFYMFVCKKINDSSSFGKIELFLFYVHITSYLIHLTFICGCYLYRYKLCVY